MTIRFIKLTRPTLRQLALGQKITEHGITAERLPNSDIRYSIGIMVDGERIHRVIGRESEGVTRTQAEEFITKARSDARQGRLDLPKGRKTHPTFRKAAQDYLTRLEEVGGKNIVAKRRQLSATLVPFFGDQRLDAITSFTIDRYKKRRQDEKAANGTINRELAVLSHLFNIAVEWKWIRLKPCRIMKLPEAHGRIVALSDEQSDDLLRAAMQDSDPYCSLFVAFGLNTAMRHQEILRVRFDQIDFVNLRIRIPQAKAGAREQPITPALRDLLVRERESRNDQKGWIFPTARPNASLLGRRHRMDKSFRRAVVKAGLDPKTVTPHTMRHSAITKLVKAGVDLPTIQKISGHKTLAMVMRYAHVHGDHIDHAIRAIGRSLPEPHVNNSADTATHRLHTTPKRIA